MSEDSTTLMWRGAIIPSTIVAVVAVVVSTLVRHKPGFLGALIGSATVIIFLGIHLLISAISKTWTPSR